MRSIGFGILVFWAFLNCNSVMAQGGADAFRLSNNIYEGTARSQSMGSAFGALGGDYSAVGLNPGGIGLYRSSEFSFTPSLTHTNTQGNYLDESSEDFRYQLNIGNLSYVGSVSGPGDIKQINFGIGYNRIKDFTNRSIIQTGSAKGSLLDEFVYYSNQGQGSSFYEDQAWNTDLLFISDTVTGNYSNDFQYFADGNYGQNMNKTNESSGRIGEWVFALGMNLQDKLYMGASVNIQSYKYKKTSSHTETTSPDIFTGHFEPDSFKYDQPYFKSFTFKELLNSSATGINVKVGGIYKPVQFLRIGATIHSPTSYSVTNELKTKMNSKFYEGEPLSLQSESETGETNYNVTTPARTILSMGLVYKNVGLLSVDYEYVNYKNMRLRSDNDDFMDINDRIKNIYSKTHNVRVGAEIKYNIFSFRVGGAYYDNPYSDENINNYEYFLYSGGLGVRYEGMSIDFAYVLSQKNYNHIPYRDSEPASMTLNRSKFVATVGFKF